jgi:hypothetical protein
VEIAHEIRLLVEELASGGQPALQKRLAASLISTSSAGADTVWVEAIQRKY